MQQTSWQVYQTEIKPNINAKQQVVLRALRRAKRPVCNQELSNELNQAINTITPRVLELRQKGVVEEAYRAIYPATNRKVIYWKVI